MMHFLLFQRLTVILMVLILSFPVLQIVYGQQDKRALGEWERRAITFNPPYLARAVITPPSGQLG